MNIAICDSCDNPCNLELQALHKRTNKKSLIDIMKEALGDLDLGPEKDVP